MPSSPRRRSKAAIGLSLATAGVVTAGAAFFAVNRDEPAEAAEAHQLAEARAELLPGAAQAQWADAVQSYTETVAAHQYAIAVYARLADWHAVGEYADALAAQQAAEAASYSSSSGGSSLDAIRACESGGNYSAVSSSGTYRGAYQFDQQTWQSVGGSGDPAAASPAEQDMRAQMLYDQRGSSAWSCG